LRHSLTHLILVAMNLSEHVQSLDALIVAGALQQSVEQFFAPEGVAHHNRYDRIVGKAAKQNQVANFMSHIAHIESITLNSFAVNGNVSLSEFTFAFQWQDGSRSRYAEVIRRMWHDGLVIDEKYYTGYETDDAPNMAAGSDVAYAETDTNFPPAEAAQPDQAKSGDAEKPAEKPDNLVLIEGIGPKIAGLLIEARITTFQQLADTSVDVLKAILKEAGPRYRMADASTWPQQSQLAAEGKLDDLKKLQGELRGGKA
jgi:predicted flap endonuclease-1-like 5' DNA nuclease